MSRGGRRAANIYSGRREPENVVMYQPAVIKSRFVGPAVVLFLFFDSLHLPLDYLFLSDVIQIGEYLDH